MNPWADALIPTPYPRNHLHVGAGLVPARVSGHHSGVITTGGHKILPYDVVGVSECPSMQLGNRFGYLRRVYRWFTLTLVQQGFWALFILLGDGPRVTEPAALPWDWWGFGWRGRCWRR